MRTLKTSEAATLLNVSANTLRSWERRFGYPRPRRSPGQHRLYTDSDIIALRDALLSGLSISSAISVAREGLRSGTDALTGALAAFDVAGADEAMESTLALRSLEHTVVEALLPALDHIGERHGLDSAPWAFGARWAGDWLRRALRITYPTAHSGTLLIGDATRDEFDPDALCMRALELVCSRAGMAPLCLPVRAASSLKEVLATAEPAAIVIAGSHASDDEVARWAYAVRTAAGALPVSLYRRAPRSRHIGPASARLLHASPLAARQEILDAVATHRGERAEPAAAATPRLASVRREAV